MENKEMNAAQELLAFANQSKAVLENLQSQMKAVANDLSPEQKAKMDEEIAKLNIGDAQKDLEKEIQKFKETLSNLS